MASFMIAAPILPGKSEVWRRFAQEMRASRRKEYETSRRQLGITKELMWLLQTPRGDTVIVYLDVEEPEDLMEKMATSIFPFDRWFKQQMQDIHGLSLILQRSTSKELIFVWP